MHKQKGKSGEVLEGSENNHRLELLQECDRKMPNVNKLWGNFNKL